MPNNTTTNILVLDNSNQNNFNPIINNNVANHMANLTEDQIAQRRQINLNGEEVREIIYTEVGNSLERDLRYYDLSGLDLSYIDNVGQNNRHMINFTGATLANVNFRGSYLENSTFDNANIDNANIENVDFRDSYLQNSTFANVNVRDSDFSNSNLSYVIAGGNTSFTDCNFNGANVFGCNHQNWNTINCNIGNILDLESSGLESSSDENSSQSSESDNSAIVSDSENESDNDYGNGPRKQVKPNTAGTSNTGTSNLTYRG